LAGGYKPSPISYQIFTEGGLQDVVLKQPKLKVKMQELLQKED
jgi:hypothetical protein